MRDCDPVIIEGFMPYTWCDDDEGSENNSYDTQMRGVGNIIRTYVHEYKKWSRSGKKCLSGKISLRNHIYTDRLDALCMIIIGALLLEWNFSSTPWFN